VLRQQAEQPGLQSAAPPRKGSSSIQSLITRHPTLTPTTATLVDVIGSAAIVTQADRGGVSLSINTNYLSPCPIGKVVEIEAVVAKVGAGLAILVCRA